MFDYKIPTVYESQLNIINAGTLYYAISEWKLLRYVNHSVRETNGRFNINMSSYQYRDSHYKDIMEIPISGKTNFILRRDPGNFHRKCSIGPRGVFIYFRTWLLTPLGVTVLGLGAFNNHQEHIKASLVGSWYYTLMSGPAQVMDTCCSAYSCLWLSFNTSIRTRYVLWWFAWNSKLER